jgi:hypothetical protein
MSTMTATLRKIVEEVKALGQEERRELKTLLQELEAERPGVITEEEFARKLAAKGMVSLPTGPRRPVTPVPITGKPVSEIIVEERR